MKKAICLFLSMVLIAISLVGCTSNQGEKQDDSKIQLTLDNYEQYLSLNVKYGPKSYNSKTKIYEQLTCSVEVASASTNLVFYDCSISVRVTGTYEPLTGSKTMFDEAFVINLNIGGSGSTSKQIFNYITDYQGQGYEVVSVTGSVKLS